MCWEELTAKVKNWSKQAQKWFNGWFRPIHVIDFLVFLLFVFTAYSVGKYFNAILKSLGNIFSSSLIVNLKLTLLLLFLIYSIAYYIIRYVHSRRNTQPKVWFYLTVGIMVGIFLLGSTFIVTEFTANELKLVLRNSSDTTQVLGNITCEDDSGSLLVGREVSCVTYPDLDNVTGNITFTTWDGQNPTDNLSDMKFIPPEDVKRVFIDISGIVENNTRDLEVGYDFEFRNAEEHRKTREKALTYLLALLGIVLFSVPPMMVNIKKLYESQ